MARRHDRQEDNFLKKPGLPRDYYSDDDKRGRRGARKTGGPRERADRVSSPQREELERGVQAEKIWSQRISHSREASPPPPIHRRRSTQLNEQRSNPYQRHGVPDIFLIPPDQTYDKDGRGGHGRGRAASNPIKPEFEKSLSDTAGPPPTLSGTIVDIDRAGVAISERNGPSTSASNFTAGSRWSVSEDDLRRMSFSSGVLGDKFYRYTQLGFSEIRLVRILAKRSLQVKCEILHRPFGNPPSYTAISYAWGDPSDTTKAWIRDELSSAFVEVNISKSLYLALEALRKKGEDVLVWADALSIDQQNHLEKNDQLSLMAEIYKKAQYVAVWLGPEEDDSDIATALLQEVATAVRTGASRTHIRNILSSRAQNRRLPALASLFERQYWTRLWIVQEIFNAAAIYVYCGSSKPIPWDDYQTASRVFQQYKRDLEELFPKIHSVVSQKRYSYSQILAYSGPGSLPGLDALAGLGDEALLEVLRVCRRKLSSDPKDKVFGVLGLLSKTIRESFIVDYGKSVKDVYTDAASFLLITTDCLDIICEAIYFPVYTSLAKLPTWVPDWSYVPSMSAIHLSAGTKFTASRKRKANYRFLDDRPARLEICAVPLGSISRHGIPVGTLCTLQDYLMAFLNWRALLLGDLGSKAGKNEFTLSVQEAFCETICFRGIPHEWQNRGRKSWMEACFHVFARLIQERLPCLAIDDELIYYAGMDVGLRPEARRKFLHDHFESRMMGRCFCLTNEGRMGLGTGFMAPGDEVVVPLGCSTPVLLRPEGSRGEYRFVGDVYIDGYMHGKAMDDLDFDKRQLKRYTLH